MGKKQKLKVLQLASFIGNIGDNANHIGARKYFKKFKYFDFDIHELEIREFYWNKKKFDLDFASLCNEYDLLLIGGGNYFEFWVERSSTGCSIDISEDLLSRINIPILFYSLGADAGQGYSDLSKEKFSKFIDFLYCKPEKYFLSIRNDGSFSNLSLVFGDVFAKRFKIIPDGGFFIGNNTKDSKMLSFEWEYIGINVAGDMPEKRFLYISREEMCSEIAKTIIDIANEYSNHKFIFFPHLFKDSLLIHSILSFFDDEFVRKKIIIAPIINGNYGMTFVFSLYQRCCLVIGNRFHSNVCSIAYQIPTIGLVNYPQIELLYHEIGMPERIVRIDKMNFSSELTTKISLALKNINSIKADYSLLNKNLAKKMRNSMLEVEQWLYKYYKK